MSGQKDTAATIDHQEVHVDISRGRQEIQTKQPSASYTNGGGEAGVVFQQPPNAKEKPKDYVMTSCAVLLLCNFIFGYLGYHFGVKSNYAWQLGDIDVARIHARKALIFVIVGIIVGICTYVLAITLYFTLNKSRYL